MRVGVVLSMAFDDAGEFLADAAAFDAAGADGLWLAANGDDVEALLLLAAIAAAAPRADLGLALGSASACPADLLERATATLRRLRRGRPVIVVGAEPGDTLELDRGGGDAGAERWRWVPGPENRAAWAETLAAAETAGLTGVLVAANPRLLDLLRNPDPGDGRQDLLLAQG